MADLDHVLFQSQRLNGVFRLQVVTQILNARVQEVIFLEPIDLVVHGLLLSFEHFVEIPPTEEPFFHRHSPVLIFRSDTSSSPEISLGRAQ